MLRIFAPKPSPLGLVFLCAAFIGRPALMMGRGSGVVTGGALTVRFGLAGEPELDACPLPEVLLVLGGVPDEEEALFEDVFPA